MDLEERLVRNKFDFQIIKRFEGIDGTITFRVKYPIALFSTGSVALIDADKTQEEFEQAITDYYKSWHKWQQRWVVYFSHYELLERKDYNFEEARLKEESFQQIAKQENKLLENIVKSNEKQSLEFLTSEAESLYKRCDIIIEFLKEKMNWFRNEITEHAENKVVNIDEQKNKKEESELVSMINLPEAVNIGLQKGFESFWLVIIESGGAKRHFWLTSEKNKGNYSLILKESEKEEPLEYNSAIISQDSAWRIESSIDIRNGGGMANDSIAEIEIANQELFFKSFATGRTLENQPVFISFGFIPEGQNPTVIIERDMIRRFTGKIEECKNFGGKFILVCSNTLTTVRKEKEYNVFYNMRQNEKEELKSDVLANAKNEAFRECKIFLSEHTKRKTAPKPICRKVAIKYFVDKEGKELDNIVETIRTAVNSRLNKGKSKRKIRRYSE